MSTAPLKHVSARTGRERQWRAAKLKSLAVAEAYEWLAFIGLTANANDKDAAAHARRADRIANCANRLDFTVDENGLLKLHSANRCKARFCITCQSILSRISYAQLHALVKLHAEKHPRSLPVALTMTVPNVEAGLLAGTISEMTVAFRKMRKMVPFKRAVIGWRRALEVTYAPATETYHPHFHQLLMMAPEFWHDATRYLTKAQWQAMWEQATGLPRANVWVQKKGSDRDGILVLTDNDSFAEVTKYVVKPHELFSIEDDGYRVDETILATLHKALKNRRLYDYGGTFRRLRPEARAEREKVVAELRSFMWTTLEAEHGDLHAYDYFPIEHTGERPRPREPPAATPPETAELPPPPKPTEQ